LLQRLQRLIDVVVANDDLQNALLLGPNLGGAGDNRRVSKCPSHHLNKADFIPIWCGPGSLTAGLSGVN
ncbi:MAG TPA: hypothetical protein VGJ08_08630, partial [Rhizomicrobium sp.]